MGRSPCCDKSKVKRGPWSPEEDTILKNYLHTYGTGGNWIALPLKAGHQYFPLPYLSLYVSSHTHIICVTLYVCYNNNEHFFDV